MGQIGRWRTVLLVCFLAAACEIAPPLAAQTLPAAPGTPAEPASRALDLLSPSRSTRKAAIAFFVQRGNADAMAALILADRFIDDDRDLQGALETLSGVKAATWFDWMLWQQAHPEIVSFPGFDAVQAEVFAKIDPNFRLFLKAGGPHVIRLEEIAWGGVLKDGIPALTNPKFLPADAATYLADGDLVFGVEIAGDMRAYPLRILDWHEMVNDVVGGVPVSLAYCTLCGSGILYETAVPGRPQPFVFGSSGLLYRSNKLMYDSETLTLWNQFAGVPAVGPLVGSGIALRTRPVVIARWADWRRAHPATRVLDEATGFDRDYRPGAAYGDYFASPELMFPVIAGSSPQRPKDYVFALREPGADKAWPLGLFAGGAVLNERVGAIDVVLIGDAASRTVRAYRTDGRRFGAGADPQHPVANGVAFDLSEEALRGPGGLAFTRLPGHIAYDSAWRSFHGGGN